ncbi:PaaI family thioesterase [bacterium]|nr:PaaI family thioesterase [bacterium]
MSQDRWFVTIKEFFEQLIAFDRHLGIEVVEIKRGWSRMRLPYRPEFLGDPFRPALHGGVISTMVDVAAGAAALSTLPSGSKCSTVDMRVDYLLPGLPCDLWAEGTVLRTGASVAVINVEITQRPEQESLRIATGRAVYSLKSAGRSK